MRASFSRPDHLCTRLVVNIILFIILLNTQSMLVSHASSGDANFSIAPTSLKPYDVKPRDYFIYNTFPGALISDLIHVINNGSTRGKVRLYVSDATTAPTGGTSYLPEVAPRRDVSAWIKLSYTQLTLDPGQSQEVPFTLTIPKHVRPGQHGGIILAQEVDTLYMSHPTTAKSIVIKTHTSLGLGMLVNIAGPTIEKLITKGIHYDANSQYQRLIITLENSGTQLLYPSGYVRIFDEKGKIVQNLKMQLSTFIPQTLIDYPAMIQHKRLSPGGKYTAELYLNYGQAYELSYKTNFLVPLSSKGAITNLIQDLGSPVQNPSESIFSISTLCYFAVFVFILFLILSSLFFWGKKISSVFSRFFNIKTLKMLRRIRNKRDDGSVK